ncbi:hypothetical protein E8E13_003158 [Curvularia kusanoi]|uniref:EF-hand domain-containing protein n=1 Tax=Curvularia kusanoi TaxID=90978 RepID=A0A9P4T532_CURKU|nr:hypothetical protein E8E13_003158 [Curvularia kusanoi]
MYAPRQDPEFMSTTIPRRPGAVRTPQNRLPRRPQNMEKYDIPVLPPPKEAQERHTISEDRSAGSNVEMRNLAALKDRDIKDQNVEGITNRAEGGTVDYDSPRNESDYDSGSDMTSIDGTPNYPSRARPNKGVSSKGHAQSPKGHAQSQQRFGQLRFDEEGFNDLVDENDQASLKDIVLAADITASHGQSRSQPVAKHDWAGETQPTDAGKGLQANIESLREKLARTQKELDKLERRKKALTNEQFRLIYRIEGTCYFDHPEWTQGYKSIVSRNPVKNLDLFLEKNKNIVFIVYRDFDNAPLATGAKTKSSSPQHMRESIQPVSQRLRKTLLIMLKGDWRYEAMSLELHRKGEIAAPYLYVYHHRTSWGKLVDRYPPNVREHLRLLARYVSDTFGTQYMAADALFARRKVSAEFVRYLFLPGDILVSRRAGQFRGLVANSWPQENATVPDRGSSHPEAPRAGYRQLSLFMDLPDYDVNLYSDLDGSSDFGTLENESELSAGANEQTLLRQSHHRDHPKTGFKGMNDTQSALEKTLDKEFNIGVWQWSFDGDFKRVEDEVTLRLSQSTANNSTRVKEWDMHNLDVYPLKYAPKPLIETLHRRGMMFWQCRKQRLVSYHESNVKEQDESEERFMIDFPTFRKLHSENKSYVMGNIVETMTQSEMEQDHPPDEAFYYLVPLQTKGFNLRTKKWLDLNVDQIGPVVWNERAFDSLVLDKNRKTKELITALVSKQISSSKSTDVVAGKGNGLILLLHGGPGTGKTLTAEGVAEIAKKPLYRVTCGDVGTKAEEVENYLESVLHLGKLWDCVVLLDEAEVFLERRSLDDLQRNALVSVFLRVIEYHEGILILTSNRVGTFDEAFRSRIQIAVHYPPLRAYQRLQIWKNFFDRLESFKDGSVDVEELRDHLEKLQDLEINGRQIRNAITTARQFADWKGETMNYKHLEIALHVAAEFNEYSEKLRGGFTDDQIAEEEGLR